MIAYEPFPTLTACVWGERQVFCQMIDELVYKLWDINDYNMHCIRQWCAKSATQWGISHLFFSIFQSWLDNPVIFCSKKRLPSPSHTYLIRKSRMISRKSAWFSTNALHHHWVIRRLFTAIRVDVFSLHNKNEPDILTWNVI